MGARSDLIDFFKALRTAPEQSLYPKVAEVFTQRRNGTISSHEATLLIVQVLSDHPALAEHFDAIYTAALGRTIGDGDNTSDLNDSARDNDVAYRENDDDDEAACSSAGESASEYRENDDDDDDEVARASAGGPVSEARPSRCGLFLAATARRRPPNASPRGIARERHPPPQGGERAADASVRDDDDPTPSVTPTIRTASNPAPLTSAREALETLRPLERSEAFAILWATWTTTPPPGVEDNTTAGATCTTRIELPTRASASPIVLIPGGTAFYVARRGSGFKRKDGDIAEAEETQVTFQSFANAELYWSTQQDGEGRRFGVAARAMSRRPKTLCLKRSPQAIAAPAHGYAGTFDSRRAPFEHVAPPRARARAPEALSPLVLSYARATERA